MIITREHLVRFKLWNMANERARRNYRMNPNSTHQQPPDPEPRPPAVVW